MGRTTLPITTIVMSCISHGGLRIDDDELLPATLLLLDILFAEVIEEVHDTGHS